MSTRTDSEPCSSDAEPVDPSVQLSHELPEQPQDLTDSQELYCMEMAQNADGTVDVTAYDWDRTGDTVDVQFITPTGDLESDTMDWPDGSLKDSRFMRVLDEAGYSVVDATNFGENKRTIRADPDGWTLGDGGEETDRIAPVRGLLFLGKSPILFVYNLLALWMFLAWDEPGVAIEPERYETFGPRSATALGGVIWGIILAAVFL